MASCPSETPTSAGSLVRSMSANIPRSSGQKWCSHGASVAVEYSFDDSLTVLLSQVLPRLMTHSVSSHRYLLVWWLTHCSSLTSTYLYDDSFTVLVSQVLTLLITQSLFYSLSQVLTRLMTHSLFYSHLYLLIWWLTVLLSQNSYSFDDSLFSCHR